MRRPGRPRAWILLLLGGLVPASAPALESDQYYAWGRRLDDATAVLNAKVRLEIDRALEEVNSGRRWQDLSCHQVLKHIAPRFREFIFHDIELWMTNSALVPRIPATPAEELDFRRRYLYRNTHPLDMGTKVPPSPTVEIGGVRLGTDKVSHFFSEGSWYYDWFRKSRDAGLSVEQAELEAIRRGIWWERTMLGMLSSGVFSPGDLEANYQGMCFMARLCDDESPELVRTDSGWIYTGAFDFSEFVSPEWDESWQSPAYGKRRWAKVRPVLEGYCSLLSDPRVAQRRREYRRRDRRTVTERELRRLVEAGKLPDPDRFSIERVCADAEGGAEAAASAVEPAAAGTR
jgi:hypothetical protein